MKKIYLFSFAAFENINILDESTVNSVMIKLWLVLPIVVSVKDA